MHIYIFRYLDTNLENLNVLLTFALILTGTIIYFNIFYSIEDRFADQFANKDFYLFLKNMKKHNTAFVDPFVLMHTMLPHYTT